MIEVVRQITSKDGAQGVQDKVINILMDLCQTDTEKASKAKLKEIKSLLQPHFTAYKNYLKRVHSCKKQWLLQSLKTVFTGGLHTYNRSAAIEHQLKSKIVNEEDGERAAVCTCPS